MRNLWAELQSDESLLWFVHIRIKASPVSNIGTHVTSVARCVMVI